MKVRFTLDTGYAGAEHEDEFEFNDDMTGEEIEEELKEWAWDRISTYWEKVD